MTHKGRLKPFFRRHLCNANVGYKYPTYKHFFQTAFVLCGEKCTKKPPALE